jgi:hypothetical protein
MMTRDPHTVDLSKTPAAVSIQLSPRWVALAFFAMIVGLEIAHVTTSILRYEFGYETQFGLVRQFNLDEEANLPTWYSSTALLLVALLLTMIGVVKRGMDDRYARHWLLLAAMFLYLSADEAARLHEMSEPFTTRLHLTGYLFYPWIIGGAAIVLLVGLAYLPFVWHLPRGIRALVVSAGMLYVGGALGIEAIGANMHYRYGFENMRYSIAVAAEESGEMFGVLLFGYALMRYIAQAIGTIAISFNDRAVRKKDTPQLHVTDSAPERAA